MSNKLRWIAAFSVKQEISKKFQKWMEDTHFPELEETDCFTGTTRKTFQESVKEGGRLYSLHS